jgi:hypothetical protein
VVLSHASPLSHVLPCFPRSLDLHALLHLNVQSFISDKNRHYLFILLMDYYYYYFIFPFFTSEYNLLLCKGYNPNLQVGIFNFNP